MESRVITLTCGHSRDVVAGILACKRVTGRLKIEVDNRGPLTAGSHLTTVMVARSEGSVPPFGPLTMDFLLPPATLLALLPVAPFTSHPVLLTGPSERFP